MPHDALESFRVRRDMVGIHRWHDDAGVCFLCSVTAIAAYDASDSCTDLLCYLNGGNKIGAHVLFEIAATDGENKKAILRADAAAFKPFGEDGRPAFVICSRGEFGDIVRGRISFEAANLAEVVHGMARVARAAA